MFKSTKQKPGKLVKFFLNGETFTAIDGDNVAAALLRAGHVKFRKAKNDDMRGPYCMMGTCFECLVEINGRPNQQACQTTICDGMCIRHQDAPNQNYNVEEEVDG